MDTGSEYNNAHRKTIAAKQVLFNLFGQLSPGKEELQEAYNTYKGALEEENKALSRWYKYAQNRAKMRG